MSITVTDFISVSKKLSELNIEVKDGLAIIPDNFDKAVSEREFAQQVEAASVRTLFRINDAPLVELFNNSAEPTYIQNNSFEWSGPTFFLTAATVIQNPHVISISLGLLTNYLYDQFKGRTQGAVSLNFVYEKPDGSCKKVSYKGPIEGLNTIIPAIEKIQE
jgi:hypothetical protein